MTWPHELLYNNIVSCGYAFIRHKIKSGGHTDRKRMLTLTSLGVDVFINKSKTKNQKSFWNNYDLIIWSKNSSGYSDKRGMFLKEWGMAEIIPVNEQGLWKLPKRYVKYFK